MLTYDFNALLVSEDPLEEKLNMLNQMREFISRIPGDSAKDLQASSSSTLSAWKAQCTRSSLHVDLALSMDTSVEVKRLESSLAAARAMKLDPKTSEGLNSARAKVVVWMGNTLKEALRSGHTVAPNIVESGSTCIRLIQERLKFREKEDGVVSGKLIKDVF